MGGDLVRSGIKVFLVVVFVGIILNDIGQVAVNYYNAGEKANQIANAAMHSFQVYKSEAVAQNEALKTAASQGVALEFMKVDKKEAVVQIKSDTVNTLWAHRIKPLVPYLSIHVRTTTTPF